MCGRAYSTYTDDEISFQYLNRRPLKFGPLKPLQHESDAQRAYAAYHRRCPGIRPYAMGIGPGMVSRVFHEVVDDQREERNGIRKQALQKGDRPKAMPRSRQWILRMEAR